MRKKSCDKILKWKLKKQHLSTVTQFCPLLNFQIAILKVGTASPLEISNNNFAAKLRLGIIT